MGSAAGCDDLANAPPGGVALERAASVGAAADAVLSILAPACLLQFVLGAATVGAAAFARGLRRGQRNMPVEGTELSSLRDRPGELASAYPRTAVRWCPASVPGDQPRRRREAAGDFTGGSGGFEKIA